MKGNLYDMYVSKVTMHGSETWPMTREDNQQMTRTERSMVRRMCGVSLKARAEWGSIEAFVYRGCRGDYGQ